MGLEYLIKDSPGEIVLFLGNEAIARGAIEAGVGVVSTYPGTPSSEIADSLSWASPKVGFYMEYSTNEKVAMEVAGAAAMCGVRSLVCMKHVGLNVASDAFMSLVNTGVDGGMIVVSADDPMAWSSQNEQDNRFYAWMSGAPMLEPSSPQEAKEMVLRGFDLSEKLNEPVLLRTTTRISHTRGNVKLGPMRKPVTKGTFEKDPSRFVLVPANFRVRRLIVLDKIREAKKISEETDLNFVEGEAEIGIITSGVSYNYVKEALDLLNVEASILKLGMTNPLPEEKICDFLREHKPVFIVEELEQYLETRVRAIANREVPEAKVMGKSEGLFPSYYEFSTRRVVEGLSKALKKEPSVKYSELDKKVGDVAKKLPPRPPVLCPGCPHRATFYEIKKVTKGKAIYPSDIGCYTLGIQFPFNVADTCLCMGSSVGVSCGISTVSDQPIVAVIGDSTFFHAGIPPLIDAVYNQHKFTLVVLDNETTAMTGHQPHPGTGVKGTGSPGNKVKIEDVARGCGVKYVKVVDPFNVEEALEAIKGAVEFPGPAVVVARRICILLEIREKRRKGIEIVPYVVDPEKCTGCKTCINKLGCPAIYWDADEEKAVIEPTICVDCGVCAQICPVEAISRRK